MVIYLGTYAVKGIITFALGGVLLIFAVMFLQLFFTRYPSDIGNMINGLPLAFVGFLFVGLGFWGIVKDATESKSK
jgi:hypothetical protein